MAEDVAQQAWLRLQGTDQDIPCPQVRRRPARVSVAAEGTEGCRRVRARETGLLLAATMARVSRSEVLLVGGPAGVGKTSVAAELHHQLSVQRVQHALIEGDTLDQAWPPPWQQGMALAEANLASMWRRYTEAGYRRLLYTNTASVREDVMASLMEALGGRPVVHGVLLTGTERTLRARLEQRERGSALQATVGRSLRAATQLEQAAPAWVHRIPTDGRTITDIAAELARLLRWEAQPTGTSTDT